MESVQAVIQAGGLGQRIRAAAGDTPKPLLQVGGVAMIERLLCQLVAAGIRNVTVVCGAKGDSIRSHLIERSRSLPRDLRLDFFIEHSALGNAGALAELPPRSGPVIFCFADLVTDLDFDTLMKVHRERGCNVTLTSHFEHHQLSLGELTIEGDRVRAYTEKPRKRFLICSGIAAFDSRAMSVARLLPRPYGLSDLVNAILRSGCTVTHWLHEAYWIDVNTPELLALAQENESRRAGNVTQPVSFAARRLS